MHGVQRVGLVVVPPLVVAHVNRDWRVEGGEDVVGSCQSNRKVQTELVNEHVSGEETSKKKNKKILRLDFERKRGGISKANWGPTIKATGISGRAERFRVTYWHYHTGGVE